MELNGTLVKKISFGIVVFLVAMAIVYIVLLTPRAPSGPGNDLQPEQTPVETVEPTPVKTATPMKTPVPEKTPELEEKIELLPCKGILIQDGEEERLAITINSAIDADQKNYALLLEHFGESSDFGSNYDKISKFYYFVSEGETAESDLVTGKAIKCTWEIVEDGNAGSLDYAVLFAGLAQASGFESAVVIVSGYLENELYVLPGVLVDESTPELSNLNGNYYAEDKLENRYLLVAPFEKECFFSCDPEEDLTAIVFKVE